MTSRWSNYYLNRDFEGFWRMRLAENNASVCVIAGIGFDPRSLTVLERIIECGSKEQIGYIALHLRPPSAMSDASRKLEQLTLKNKELLDKFTELPFQKQEEISLRDIEGHLVGGRAATNIINKFLSELNYFQDVLVDISGLPRAVFYPLLAFLCARADQGKIRNLHVAVTEDSTLDSKIRGGEYGNPDYVYPFRAEASRKLVWLPVISTSETERLRKIHTQIEGECVEICPILPFPAKDMRRADEILMHTHSILFERMLVSRNNLLLCDERTPFDIYRKIIEVDDYYRQSLANLPGIGEVTTVVSPLASKMLSLGMLLAAIERKLPVTYAEAGSYQIYSEADELAITHPDVSPIEVWVIGEPYE